MLILICDDEHIVRVGLISILEELEPGMHTYIEANNGVELVELASQQPDMAFVDIQMPMLNGLDAIEQARGKSPKTKWFVLTGYSEFAYAQKALGLGVSDYLLKPFGKNEISQVMQKAKGMIDNDRVVNTYLNTVTDMDFNASSMQCIAMQIKDVTDLGDRPKLPMDIVSKTKAILQSHYKEPIGVNSIADRLGITPNYLSRLFREHTGIRLTDYLTQMRIEKAKSLLESSGASVKYVAGEVGYYSVKHFSNVFMKVVGISPSEYRKTFSKNSKS